MRCDNSRDQIVQDYTYSPSIVSLEGSEFTQLNFQVFVLLSVSFGLVLVLSFGYIFYGGFVVVSYALFRQAKILFVMKK